MPLLISSKSDTTLATYSNIEDFVYTDIIRQYNKPYESIHMDAPAQKSESYYAYINPSPKTWYKSETYCYDQRTAELLKTEKPEDLNGGEYVRNMFYDIHIGKILGLPGQFLVFFASLVVASLPITGFYIWYGRRKRKVIVIKDEKEPLLSVPVTID
jgi:uncharacterized iron-regulated membrane protein